MRLKIKFKSALQMTVIAVAGLVASFGPISTGPAQAASLHVVAPALDTISQDIIKVHYVGRAHRHRGRRIRRHYRRRYSPNYAANRYPRYRYQRNCTVLTVTPRWDEDEFTMPPWRRVPC